MGDAHIGDTRLHVGDTGDGPPLVLIHGFPLDGRVWDEVVPLLPGRRVIVPDLRGFGRSQPAGDFTIGSLACDVAALIVAMGYEKAAVAGLSMGGYVAQEMLRVAPQVVDRLILIDTKPDADNVEAQNKRIAMANLATEHGSEAVADAMLPNMLAGDAEPAVRRRLREIMTSQRPETLARACIAMRDREDFVALLQSAGCPIGLLVGEHDAITPPVLFESLHSRLKSARLHLIPGAGHMAPLERPALVAEALLMLTSDGNP
jgi:pimeloyl-ACP methyl ester carboxylesterase